MNALLRVLRAPELVLGMWGLHLLLAFTFGRMVRTVVAGAMRHHAFLDEGHRLAAVAELTLQQPGIGSMMFSALLASTLLGTFAWFLASAGLVARLAGSARRPSEVAKTCVSFLPAMAVQTFYGLIVRALLVGGLVAAASLLDRLTLTLGVFVFTWCFSLLVLDRARTSVVLGAASRFSPRTTLRALVHVAGRPKLWTAGFVLCASQWLVAYGMIALAIADPFSGATIWFVRVAAIATVGLGLWRLSLVVDESTVKNASVG